MGDSFFFYLHRLELIAFFSGYPLMYATVLLIGGMRRPVNELKKKLVALLPFSYALVGTLYFGFELMNLPANYSTDNFREFAQHPFLAIWGLLAILFWIPALARRPFISLMHSLVFFILLIKDLFYFRPGPGADTSMVSNDMKLYTYSLFLHITSFITVTLIYFLLRWYKSIRKSSHSAQ
jgi:hypothetical protein